MGNSIDSASYISALNNATSLLPKETNLQKTKKKKSEETKTKKNKTFLESFLEPETNTLKEIDYEKKLQGLEPTERKKVIDDILAELQDRVYSSGANLADNINSDTISAYKKAVKSFVNFAVNHSLDAKSVISGGLNPMKQRQYVIVKVIDEKVERLTKELLFNQLEKLTILEKLDEIKGLLVDLTT